MRNQFIRSAIGLLLAPALLSAPAFADEPLDELDIDELLGNPDESSAKRERQALERDAEREADTSEEPAPPSGERRVIKTLQKKSFMKIDRYEAGLGLGFVSNDSFLQRYVVAPSIAYHITEIFALEAFAGWSPDFGDADYKAITRQIIEENKVTPDISKVEYFANVNFQFSPIYGKVAVLGKNIVNFDIFGTFGTGFVNTRDDLIALGKETDQEAINTQVQFHPTLNFGGGARVIFSNSFAVRAEARGMSYIEVIEGTNLEMKNSLTILGTATFFFPGMK